MVYVYLWPRNEPSVASQMAMCSSAIAVASRSESPVNAVGPTSATKLMLYINHDIIYRPWTDLGHEVYTIYIPWYYILTDLSNEVDAHDLKARAITV